MPAVPPPSSDAAIESGAPVPAKNGGVMHWIIVLVVFSLTGSLAVFVSRLVLKDLLGLEGSFWGGPWSYRLTYLVLIPPAYSALLATIGTLLGKGPYFRQRVVKMWRRLLPSFVANRIFGAPKENR
ncbi:MAG: hypothetical protein KC502_10760 [Myxococcales bacterium]|nr:hypothetical protein [Myxococcales bacterium]